MTGGEWCRGCARRLAVVVALVVTGTAELASAQAPPSKYPPATPAPAPKYPPAQPTPPTQPTPPAKYPPAQPEPVQPGGTPPAGPSPAPRSTTPRPSPSSANDDGVMTDNSHDAWLAVGFGPSIGVVGCVRRLCNTEQAFTQFTLSEDFGYHLGASDGIAIGANLQQAFGSDVYRFGGGFRLWWDWTIHGDYAFYVTPMIHAGYSLSYFDFGQLGSIVDHHFNAQAGLAFRMVLADRALVYVQPFTANVLVGADGVALFHDIAVGGGFTFDP